MNAAVPVVIIGLLILLAHSLGWIGVAADARGKEQTANRHAVHSEPVTITIYPNRDIKIVRGGQVIFSTEEP